MASEASWNTSSAGGGSDDFAADQPMDQRTVESLLRRLVERVEDSERRYGQALDELHARLDQLSQTTEAVRDTSPPENADTFDRLHTQVSNLARRLEQDSSTPLDDFERLGKALSGGLHQNVEDAPSEPFGYAPEPSPFAQAAMAGETPEPNAAPEAGFPEFGYADQEPTHPMPPAEAIGGSGSQASDLDKRLVEIAQQLEHSIGTAMPTAAIEALNTRLDAIGGQLSQTLEKAPTREALEHVERQISDISQQVNRAEEQLGKIAGIETHLIKLVERLDEKASSPTAQTDPAQLETIANKAATEAARLVTAEAKHGAERIDAIHRDLSAMDNKTRERGDRLVSTLEAVHQSLKQLAQQIERGSPATQPKPRAPFLERPRQAEAKETPAKAPIPQARPAEPPKDEPPKDKAPAPTPAPAPAKSNEDPQPAPKETLRDRLGAAIPDFEAAETPPPFGRAKRSAPDEEAVDLDSTPPPKRRAGAPLGAGPSPSVVSGPASSPSQGEAGLAEEKKGADDLVAAARRAAQAAALRAEERGGRRSSRHLAGSASGTEQPTRRKRSVLVIAAAILLALSAALLYGRLMTKPEAPATEQTTPAPADATDGATTAPASGEGTAPVTDPEKSGSWAPLPDSGGGSTGSATDSANGEARTGFTDIAKSAGRAPAMPANELTPEPQLASLQPAGQAAFPPGVTFSIEDPAFGAKAAPQGFAMPAKLPMPPEALGPLPLRQAASQGNANAQFAIAIRYADGKGVARDLKKAAWWLEHAANAGLAPAQYRLAAMYERGLGIDKNLDRARSLYAAAAERGNIKAMHNLAVSVSGRDGGEPDYALAAKWYGQAAAYGLADSQFNLGILAEHGLGTPKNLADAYQWFSLAAAGGDSEAAKRREVIRVQLAPATLAKAEAAVKGWKAKDALAEANSVAVRPGWAAAAPATQNTALVTRAQTLLNQLGYDAGPPDGLIGSRTRTAIKQFQRRNGLGETGEVSIPLVTKLESLSS